MCINFHLFLVVTLINKIFFEYYFDFLIFQPWWFFTVGGIQTTVGRNPASAAGFDHEKPRDRPPGTS